MTWRQQPAIWRVEGLRPTEKLVLLALAYFGNQAGSSSYPAQKTLATMCACSVPTIKRSLKSLRNRHLIIVEGKGRKGTISYRIDLPLAARPAHKGGSPVTGGGDHQRSTIQLTNNPINKRNDSYFDPEPPGDQFLVDDSYFASRAPGGRKPHRLDSSELAKSWAARRAKR